MAFLDNSGDIILDAVLTDTGRMRLARGDGSFRIAKFALGDDEINYGLYDIDNPNGSAYYDLQILQTPILEAFTNNTSNLKSKLMSINRNDLLYLPVIKLWDQGNTKIHSDGVFYAAVNQTTVDQLTSMGSGFLSPGILNASTVGGTPNNIAADQGLDTVEISPNVALNADLVETAYIIELDNRLGSLYSPPGGTPPAPSTTGIAPAAYSFIDDDQIASYYVATSTASGAGAFVIYITGGSTADSSILGPRGTRLAFRVGSSVELRSSDFLFDQLGHVGTTDLINSDGSDIAAGKYKFIDSPVRITGVSTGYKIDIPIRYVRYTG